MRRALLFRPDRVLDPSVQGIEEVVRPIYGGICRAQVKAHTRLNLRPAFVWTGLQYQKTPPASL